MRLILSFATIAALVLALLVSGAPVAAADPDLCGGVATGWPDRTHVLGATFLGRVVSSHATPQGFDAYRFKVLRSYAGAFGTHVSVVMTCTDKKLAVGSRLLVSSGYYRPDGGAPIASMRYHWTTMAAWLVPSEDDVRLRGYGPDTPWDEAPSYLTTPDTLLEAVRAVTRPRVPVGPTAEWGPMAVVHDPAVDGLDAGMGPGRLGIGTDCVRFVGSRGPGTTLVWRDGQADWVPGSRSIRFRNLDGTRLILHDGDRVTLGGYSPPPSDIGNPPLASWRVRPNPACPSDQWAVHEVSLR